MKESLKECRVKNPDLSFLQLRFQNLEEFLPNVVPPVAQSKDYYLLKEAHV
jgi:hypothetical protein